RRPWALPPDSSFLRKDSTAAVNDFSRNTCVLRHSSSPLSTTSQRRLAGRDPGARRVYSRDDRTTLRLCCDHEFAVAPAADGGIDDHRAVWTERTIPNVRTALVVRPRSRFETFPF